MSHELRTPLNAVNGYTYLLERTNLSQKQGQYVENIRNSSKGLLELINQILDFSKIDMGHLEFEESVFSIKELVVEVQQILRVQAKEKNLYLKLNLDEKIPDMVLGDSLRLRQVLINLIGNGIKFTEQGGVTIWVSCEAKGEESCLIDFKIQDTGIGISKEAMDKIFQPFTQSDASITRKYGGTGLGLPISSQIVALSGDKTHRLKVESKQKEGSVFFFQMDFKLAQNQQKQEKKEEETIIDCSGKRILIVDDSTVNIQVQSEILKLTNAQVFTAKGGEEALELLKEEKEIDFILMDVRMPSLDGYETTKRLREIEGYEKTPVVALTADATKEVEEKIKLAGMNGCILKPVQQELLFQVMQAFLGVAKKQIAKDKVVLQQEEAKEGEATKELFQEERCLKMLAGNEKSLLQIMSTFLQFHREDDKKLMEYLQQKKWKEAKDLLHLLKGVAGNLCLESLAKECDCFGKRLQEKREEALKDWDSFFYIWSLTLEKLEKSYEEKVEKQTKDQKEQLEYSQEEALERINQLLELCMDYDTEIVDKFEESKGCLEAYLGKEDVESLKQYSIHYDFEGMKKKLQQIKDSWEVSKYV